MGPVRNSTESTSTATVALYKYTDSEIGKLSPDSTTTRTPVTKQRKHSEKRREAWRISVQKRRSAQADALDALREALPLPDLGACSCELNTGFNQLDVLRVAVSYVKLQSVLNFMLPSPSTSVPKQEDPLSKEFGANLDSLLLEGGFLIVLTMTGEILYASGNVAKYFECDSSGVLGTNLYDYVEKTDVLELNKLFSVREMQEIVPVGIGIDAFKAPSKAARLQLRSGHTFQVTGKVFLRAGIESPLQTKNKGPGFFFVGVAEPLSLPSPYNSQQLLPQIRVLSTVDWMCSGDLKQMIYSEPQLFLGYTSDEVIAANANPCKSAFDMYFPEDLPRIKEDLGKLYKRGQVEFSPYRLLAKSGGWAWVISHMSTIVIPEWKSDGSLQPGTYYAGRDFMISEVFEPQLVLASIQLGYCGDQATNSESIAFLSEVSNSASLAEENEQIWHYWDEFDSDELLELIGELETDSGC